MKRIKPLSGYDDHEGYPAVTPAQSRDGLDRRRFLQTALASTAALGGSLWLSEEARSKKNSSYQRVTFYLRGHYQYYPCRLRAESLLIQTKDKRFASFLGNAKERAATEKALSGILKSAKCADLQNAKKLARLHRKLAKGLAAHYRKRTRRRTGRPIVTLSIRPVRRIPLPGGIRRPPRPTP